ncbi:hypothetical protein HanRHA438_Chr17g0841921 [Helianthus annuus]|nr:hypothetical protein HanRHA438_Chr17g0841921 [Helianthus annuus]
MASPLHPAVTVSNIRQLIPITLDIETAHYTSWSELFKIQCKAFQVYDHLQPQTTPATSSDKDKEKEKPTESWERLDSIVLQWIYGTISQDLLHTILKPNTTAFDAWTALANLFQDNKATQTIDLNNKFASTRLDQFPNMSAYCQVMKVIFDQLQNVGSPITDEQLVLQLLTGLTEQYEGITMIIQQTKPLPDFCDARSHLCMAETRKINQAKVAAQVAGTTLTATTDQHSLRSSRLEQQTKTSERGRGRDRGRGRGRGRGSSTRGRGTNNLAPTQNYYPWPNQFQTWPAPPGYSPPTWNSWTHIPPCPYPTALRPNSGGSGVLGPRAAQSYAASYTPTNIDQALYAMSLNPQDQTWTMDTGETGSQDPNPYPTMQ